MEDRFRSPKKLEISLKIFKKSIDIRICILYNNRAVKSIDSRFGGKTSMKWMKVQPAEEEIIEGFRLKSWDNITLSVVCRRSFFIANNAIGKPPAKASI